MKSLSSQHVVVLVVIFMVIFYFMKNNLFWSDTDKKSVGVYTYKGGRWTKNTDICNGIQDVNNGPNFVKGDLKVYSHVLKVFLNDPKNNMVSKSVNEKQHWEPHVLNAIWKHIRDDPEVTLLDIGGNIGIFALQFAKMGRNVITIEPVPLLVQHMCLSIIANELQDRITVVNNAISSKHDPVEFTLPDNDDYALGLVKHNNVGLQKEMVKHYNKELWSKRKTLQFHTVTLNDISSIPNNVPIKKLFIKIDVQGFEHKTFMAADELWDDYDVRGVFIEWIWHANNDKTRNYLLGKFKQWHLRPYDCNSVLKPIDVDLKKDCIKLDIEKSKIWNIGDVLWLPV